MQRKSRQHMPLPEDTGPWNPGIESRLPSALLPLCTIFREENVRQSLAEIKELSEFTGLRREQVAAFRPQRLALHELLIRVSANYAVPDGNHYEDLGINFRRMASTLLDKYLRPNMPQIVETYDEIRRQSLQLARAELQRTLFRPRDAAKKKSRFMNLFFAKKPAATKTASRLDAERQWLAEWRQRARDADDALQQSVNLCLAHVLGAILIRHGRMRGELDMLAELTVQQVCNAHASRCIGELIEPMIERGAELENYAKLPVHAKPVIMNVKGAAASGKSTMRPMQHQLADKLGLHWEHFALISPDIWRKFLLDYASLGEHYKYAGTCTGAELQIIDQKLDLLMADKGAQRALPHLLIDRFRFDSFKAGSAEAGGNLLTRFGDKVFMYYMITPPDATVERAWKRGLKVGRFKAVDDLLAHNVEAFAGMPRNFFLWALNREKEVHYEFLDNSVNSQQPRSVAFGDNGALYILDLEKLMDINRFEKINVNANSPTDVYARKKTITREDSIRFAKNCIDRLQRVTFVDRDSGRVAMRIENGQLLEWSETVLNAAVANDAARAALLDLFPERDDALVKTMSAPQKVDAAQHITLGQWHSTA